MHLADEALFVRCHPRRLCSRTRCHLLKRYQQKKKLPPIWVEKKQLQCRISEVIQTVDGINFASSHLGPRMSSHNQRSDRNENRSVHPRSPNLNVVEMPRSELAKFIPFKRPLAKIHAAPATLKLGVRGCNNSMWAYRPIHLRTGNIYSINCSPFN